MTNSERQQLINREHVLNTRINALVKFGQDEMILDIMNEYAAEVNRINKAVNRSYEFIYNFKGGGWNTASGFTMEEAQASAAERFPDGSVDMKSFRVSTDADYKACLSLFY